LVKAEEEYRALGSIKWNTIKKYFGSMNWFLFVNYVLFTFVVYFVRITLDFWLRSEVDPTEGGSRFFDFINRFFDYDF
jgi:hypothetical protein